LALTFGAAYINGWGAGMPDGSDHDSQRRRPLGLLLRLFFELSLGSIGVLALATIAGPRLFDMQGDFAVIGAILVWLSCPVLIFILGAHGARLWRRINGGPPS
jgi:hypothetical protein